MGLIVYLSDFGPTAHPWFPLWWDMLAVAAFCLAIFVLVAGALRSPELTTIRQLLLRRFARRT